MSAHRHVVVPCLAILFVVVVSSTGSTNKDAKAALVSPLFLVGRSMTATLSTDNDDEATHLNDNAVVPDALVLVDGVDVVDPMALSRLVGEECGQAAEANDIDGVETDGDVVADGNDGRSRELFASCVQRILSQQVPRKKIRIFRSYSSSKPVKMNRGESGSNGFHRRPKRDSTPVNNLSQQQLAARIASLNGLQRQQIISLLLQGLANNGPSTNNNVNNRAQLPRGPLNHGTNNNANLRRTGLTNNVNNGNNNVASRFNNNGNNGGRGFFNNGSNNDGNNDTSRNNNDGNNDTSANNNQNNSNESNDNDNDDDDDFDDDDD